MTPLLGLHGLVAVASVVIGRIVHEVDEGGVVLGGGDRGSPRHGLLAVDAAEDLGRAGEAGRSLRPGGFSDNAWVNRSGGRLLPLSDYRYVFGAPFGRKARRRAELQVTLPMC